MKTTVFFATDVHGSEVCWRKFVNSGKHYDANVLILGGDMTGKAIVPVISDGAGRYHFTMQDVRHDLEGDEAVQAADRQIRDHGYYPVRMTVEEMTDFQEHPEKLDAVFEREMLQTIERWMAFADERLTGSGLQCIVCPGNDDSKKIDPIIDAASSVTVGEGNIVEMPGGYQLASSGYTNPTPWDTHREEGEAELKSRIDSVVHLATVDTDHLVLGLHCPPYDTALDVAPKIDWDTLTVQGQDTAHVGSTAVREVIDEVQPLLSLHGHIHECRAAIRMGRTLAVNPGSTYVEGTLSGCLIELDGKSKVKRYRLTSG